MSANYAQRVIKALQEMPIENTSAPEIRAVVERALLPTEPTKPGMVVRVNDRMFMRNSTSDGRWPWFDGDCSYSWAQICAVGIPVEYVPAGSARAHTEDCFRECGHA